MVLAASSQLAPSIKPRTRSVGKWPGIYWQPGKHHAVGCRISASHANVSRMRPNMEIQFEIGSVGDLVDVAARRELERQADFILTGAPRLRDEAEDADIFSLGRLRKPKDIDQELLYKAPKVSTRFSRYHGRIFAATCTECRRPMSHYSGSRCRFCYRVSARLRYYKVREVRAGVADQQEQITRGMWSNAGDYSERTQITMPTTEWWDETDEGMVRFARVHWKRQSIITDHQ